MRSDQMSKSVHHFLLRPFPGSQKAIAKPPGFEELEQRVLLAGHLNDFAQFSGSIAVRHEVDEIAMRIDGSDFGLQNRRVFVGFALKAPDGQTLDPGQVKVIQAGIGSNERSVLRNVGSAGDQTNLTLARLRRGDFDVRLRAAGGTTGLYELDVFLAGDANADFRVDEQDIDLIRSLHGVHVGDPRYVLDADVDGSGAINRSDVQWATLNLGVSTEVRPLFVTVGLDTSLDQDGDGVVNRWDVPVLGQTNPAVTVRLDQGADGTFEDSAVADVTGSYRFAINALVGDNPIRAEVSDRFGQHASAALQVRRSTNTAITTDAGVQQMPSVAVDALDSKHIVVAYMNRSLLSTGYAGIAVAVSRDGGESWQASSIPLPAGFDQGASDPIAKFDDQGHVYVSFMAATFLGPKPGLTNPSIFNPDLGVRERTLGFQANNGVFVARSNDGGITWNQPVAVASNRYDGQHQVPFDIIPDLAIDTFPRLPDGRSNPTYGNMYVTWARYFPPGQFPGEPTSTGGSVILFSVSSDGGQTWQLRLEPGPAGVPVTVIRDNFFSGVGVPSGLGAVNWPRLAVGPDGDVYVAIFKTSEFWVFHSNDGGVSFTAPDRASELGLPFGTADNVAATSSLGLRTNHFRTQVTRGIVADPARPGHVYVTEVDDATDANGNVVDEADTHFSRSSDFGQTWQPTFQLGGDSARVLNDDNDGQLAMGTRDDVISGQALPRMAVDSHGNVALIWYDTRRDPSNHVLNVFGTLSRDSGQTFSRNFRISDESFDADLGRFTDPTGTDNFYMGDTIGLALEGDSAFAAWTDTRAGNQDVYFRRFSIAPVPEALNDQFEPNDTPDFSASPTELGRIVRRVLPKLAIGPDDQDWFRFKAVATGEVSINAIQSETGDKLALELYDGTGTLLLARGTDSIDREGQIVGERIVFPSRSGETFQVRVRSVGGANLRYSLALQALTADLGAQVHRLVSGAAISGDESYYLVQTSATGLMELKLTSQADLQGDLNLVLRDPDTLDVIAQGVSSGRPGAGEVERISVAVEKGRSVILHVFGAIPTSGDFMLEFTNLDQFTTAQNKILAFPAGRGPSQSALGDLNGDGNVDLAVSNTLTNTVSVLLGGGDGTFQAARQFAIGAFSDHQGTFSLPSFRRDVAIADVNGDQFNDLIVTNYDASDISVLLGRGDGTFEPQRRFDAKGNPFSLAVGDVNNDNKPDLVVLDSSSRPQTVAILIGKDNGTFNSAQLLPLPPIQPFAEIAVRIADINNDHDNDLVIAGGALAPVFSLFGNGDGTFQPGNQVSELGVGLDVADVDGDGILDVVSTAYNNNAVVYAIGNGDGTFVDQVSLFAGQSPLAVTVADFGSLVSSPDGSMSMGPADGHPDLIVANSGVSQPALFGPAEVVLLPGLVNDQGAFNGFGSPLRLALGQFPQDVDAVDLNHDGANDVVVTEAHGVRVIYGAPPLIAPNDTPQTARNLGTVVHLVEQTLTIVSGHEDAFFKLTVPEESFAAAGYQVIDFSALFEATEGAGISMEVLDAGGNVLGSGERFRLQAPKGAELTLHVFGVKAANGTSGAGAYTLDIDVLPQVVSIEAQPLVPGITGYPGGPTSSLVITFQGDRLDPVTAQDPANYRVTWLGPDGTLGTSDDQVIPVFCGEAGNHCLVHDPSANVDVASGKTYPTAVRQTVTFTFAQSLPAGSYAIELLPGIEVAPFNEDESELLVNTDGISGHPVVSVVNGVVISGSRQTAGDLVLPAGGLGDFSVFKTGTPFLKQLHDDLAALLDSQLTELGDDPSVTPAIMDQIFQRFNPSLGPLGERPTPAVVIWIDPGGIDVEDPNGDDVIYDPDDHEIVNENPCAFIDVTGNIIITVFVDCGPSGGGSGTFSLNVSNIGPSVRGGVISFGQNENESIELTDALRAGTTSFTLEF